MLVLYCAVLYAFGAEFLCRVWVCHNSQMVFVLGKYKLNSSYISVCMLWRNVSQLLRLTCSQLAESVHCFRFLCKHSSSDAKLKESNIRFMVAFMWTTWLKQFHNVHRWTRLYRPMPTGENLLEFLKWRFTKQEFYCSLKNKNNKVKNGSNTYFLQLKKTAWKTHRKRHTQKRIQSKADLWKCVVPCVI